MSAKEKRECAVHGHPMDSSIQVYGIKLKPGDILHPADVYDSTSGQWVQVPCPGLTLGEGSAAYFVRLHTSLPAGHHYNDSSGMQAVEEALEQPWPSEAISDKGRG